MDQTSLVKSGHALIDALSEAGIAPRAAIWVYNSDADIWRLWIVPSNTITDQREFYRRIAEVIAQKIRIKLDCWTSAIFSSPNLTIPH